MRNLLMASISALALTLSAGSSYAFNDNTATATGTGGTGIAGAHSSSGASAGASAGSSASSGSNSSSYSGGNKLGQGQLQGQDQNNSIDGDDTDVNAWGFSYVDSAITVPFATINDGVVVTSQNLKVLGPIFGYSWQSKDFTPTGLMHIASFAYRATTNDGTYDDERMQFAAIATICAYEPDLAEQLKIACE